MTPTKREYDEKYRLTTRGKEVRANYMKSGKGKSSYLKYLYGITLQDYQNLLTEQAEGCAICGTKHGEETKYKRLSVDHNHETKKVRGLLCQRCNFGIGKFRDSAALLRKAAAYLEKHDA